jgi:hypothetical protein
VKVLACVVAYNRPWAIEHWLRAWQHAVKYEDTKLLVVQNYDAPAAALADEVAMEIRNWPHDYDWQRKNVGQDVWAFRDVLRNREFDPWDVVYWSTDDNLPMRNDFLKAFVEPFKDDPKLGLVGNYWVKGEFYKRYPLPVGDHFRTTSFAIRREAAMQLCFPKVVENKQHCYEFEWCGPMTLTAQVNRMGYGARPVGGDWDAPWTEMNEYVWDAADLRKDHHDVRCRKDLWRRYEEQIPKAGFSQ